MNFLSNKKFKLILIAVILMVVGSVAMSATHTDTVSLSVSERQY